MKHERITVDPRIMVGKPVIKGTRITVESILRKLGAGWTIEQIVDAHPRLTPEDIYAAAEYAADTIANEAHRALKHQARGEIASPLKGL